MAVHVSGSVIFASSVMRYAGHGQWTPPVLMTANPSSHFYWNIGFEDGSKLYVLELRVTA